MKAGRNLFIPFYDKEWIKKSRRAEDFLRTF